MDFKRSSGFFQDRKLVCSPDAALRKPYTHTLSEGFKEYFSSYPHAFEGSQPEEL